MSYIVPKDKPKSCKYCRFLDRITYECELSKEDYADFKEQYEHCPLIEVNLVAQEELITPLNMIGGKEVLK